MKIPYIFLLTVCAAGSASAVPAPTLDSSVYNGGYDPYAAPAAYKVAPSSASIADSLTKLQIEVSQLKNKVAEQSRVMNELKTRQSALERGVPLAASISPNLHPVTTSYQNTYGADPVSEKGRYNRAYAIFRDGGYDQAIAEFQAIINSFPAGEYADNSQYWIGEALLKKGNKQAAMVAFDRVVRVYATSAKVPDALLKLGMTQYSLGNKAKAKEYYDYLIEAYPNASSARIAFDKKLQAGL